MPSLAFVCLHLLSFAFAFFRLPDACQPSLQSRRSQKPASPVALTRKIRAKCPVLLVFGLLACHFRAKCLVLLTSGPPACQIRAKGLVLLISGPPTCHFRAKCPVLLTSGPPTCHFRAKCPVLLGFGDASHGGEGEGEAKKGQRRRSGDDGAAEEQRIGGKGRQRGSWRRRRGYHREGSDLSSPGIIRSAGVFSGRSGILREAWK